MYEDMSTLARNELTERDRQVIAFCQDISEILEKEIPTELQKPFIEEFGKIHFSRDSGSGRSGKKLQRDAICTRGNTKNDPISNRNLRWHPLVLAHKTPPGFNDCILKIDNEIKTIIIEIDEREWYPDEFHELTAPYCVTTKSWKPYIKDLKDWKKVDWNTNRAFIKAIEYCPWYDALESFTILGMIIASTKFKAEISTSYQKIITFLQNISLDKIDLPTINFPKAEELNSIILCPICLTSLNAQPASMKKRERPEIWRAPWSEKKGKEGDDAHLQILHVNPLVENEIRHNAMNVRYGHRWCNAAQTNHSLEDLINYMRKVCDQHKR